MVTDIQHTRSKSFISDSRTNTTSLRGSVDATLTRKLFGNLVYGLSWTSSEGDAILATSSNTRELATTITYRPGRFINLTGSFRLLNMDDGTEMSEGMLIDWLPVPAVRLNLNYSHGSSDSELTPSTSDLLSAYMLWYITKFLDLQLTFSYSRQELETEETKSYSFGANLNCRFW